MARGLFALEDMEAVDDTVEKEAVEINDTTAQDGSDVSEISENISDGLEATTELETVKLLMDQANLSDADISVEAINLATLTISSVYKRLSINKPSPVKMVTIEDFKTKAARKMAAGLVSEAIKFDIKSIYNAIMAAIARMVEAVKKFFRNLLSENATLKAKIKNVIKRVEQTVFPDQAVEVKNEDLAHYFNSSASISANEIYIGIDKQLSSFKEVVLLVGMLGKMLEDYEKIPNEQIPPIKDDFSQVFAKAKTKYPDSGTFIDSSVYELTIDTSGNVAMVREKDIPSHYGTKIFTPKATLGNQEPRLVTALKGCESLLEQSGFTEEATKDLLATLTKMSDRFKAWVAEQDKESLYKQYMDDFKQSLNTVNTILVLVTAMVSSNISLVKNTLLYAEESMIAAKQP